MSMTSAGPTRSLALVLMGWLVALTGCSPASIPDQGLWEQRISEAVAEVEGVEDHELDIEFSGAYGRSASYRVEVVVAPEQDLDTMTERVSEAVMPVLVEVPYSNGTLSVDCSNPAGDRRFRVFNIYSWAEENGIAWPPEPTP